MAFEEPLNRAELNGYKKILESDGSESLLIGTYKVEDLASESPAVYKVETCEEGTHLEGRTCEDDKKSCSITNGTGEQEWLGSEYGPCAIKACDSGYKQESDQCILECSNDEHPEGGQCVNNTKACPIDNGSGEQTWNGSGYGNCEAKSCTDGFNIEDGACVASCEADQHIEDGNCVSNEKPCAVANGTGKQIWDGAKYGSCTVVNCDSGYKNESNQCVSACESNEHLENGNCVSNTKACPIENGSGASMWDGSKYGPCTVVSCNNTYSEQNNACVLTCQSNEHTENGSCVSNVKSCPLANGIGEQTWNGSSYGACNVKTCNDGYSQQGNECSLFCQPNEHVENGSCVSNVKNCSIENGTGEQIWDGQQYGVCELKSCNDGFKEESGACVDQLACTYDGQTLENGQFHRLETVNFRGDCDHFGVRCEDGQIVEAREPVSCTDPSVTSQLPKTVTYNKLTSLSHYKVSKTVSISPVQNAYQNAIFSSTNGSAVYIVSHPGGVVGRPVTTGIYRVGSNGITKTGNLGKSWYDRDTFFASNNGNTILLLRRVGNTHPRQVFLSNDSGATWTNITPGSPRSWTLGAVSDDGKTLVLGSRETFVSRGAGGVFVSRDAGQTWTDTEISIPTNVSVTATSDNSQSVSSLACDSDCSTIGVTGRSSYEPAISSDFGQSWSYPTNSARGSMIKVNQLGDKIFVGDGAGSAFWVSKDSGLSWEKQSTPRKYSTFEVASEGDEIVAFVNSAGAGNHMILVSNDLGENWQRETLNVSPDFNIYSTVQSGTGKQFISLTTPKIQSAGYKYGLAFIDRTSQPEPIVKDSSDKWSFFSFPGSVNDIAVSNDTKIVYVATTKGVFKSTDGFETWVELQAFSGRDIKNIGVNVSQSIVIGAERWQVFLSEDDGLTATNALSTGFVREIAEVKVSPDGDHLTVILDETSYKTEDTYTSDDRGLTWTLNDNAFPIVNSSVGSFLLEGSCYTTNGNILAAWMNQRLGFLLYVSYDHGKTWGYTGGFQYKSINCSASAVTGFRYFSGRGWYADQYSPAKSIQGPNNYLPPILSANYAYLYLVSPDRQHYVTVTQTGVTYSKDSGVTRINAGPSLSSEPLLPYTLGANRKAFLIDNGSAFIRLEGGWLSKMELK
ncbi:MAG: hypothetical protein AAF202_02025, partial [Pseudomonadota bacterium]